MTTSRNLYGPRGSGHARADGYITIGAKGHPIAGANGKVYLHRKVLYGAIGPGAHGCHVCGAPVTWGVDLWVDHLDWDKTNNDSSNLAPSCPRCNSVRWKDRNDSGPRNPNAKLSQAQVDGIRAATGRQVDIAARFGISQQTVSRLRKRVR